MTSTDIYKDIATRTNGNIYIGVVGPVRTGKSTFIRKTMEHMVLNEIDDPYLKERTIDELPQASAGKTIMTTEPKFVPEDGIEINLGENNKCNIRMVDCVGYVVDGALGQTENDGPRMVQTAWSEQELPFDKAAEIGTQKVIHEHSTINVVITTDGSIGDILREDYIPAEKKIIKEMKESGKPFVVVLNSMFPSGEQTLLIREAMEHEYGVPVMIKNCSELSAQDIEEILSQALLEFPISKINVDLPSWITYLDPDNEIKLNIYSWIRNCAKECSCIRQIESLSAKLKENEYIKDSCAVLKSLGDGTARLDIKLDQGLYFNIISRIFEKEIKNDGDLMIELTQLIKDKKEYDKIRNSFEIAKQNGYGIVRPSREELLLDKPEGYRQGSRFGVKIKATAPTYHIIKSDIMSEISPIVGDEEQSNTLLSFMDQNYGENNEQIWNYNIFGKTVYDMVSDGLESKFERLPDEARYKLQETLSKILNEGSGGLICIIL